jgi:predicted DNA-binding protein
MPTSKKRLQITPSEEVYVRLKNLSESTNTPMSKLVTDILDHVVPSLEIFSQIMEAAKAMSDEAPKAFVKDLEDVKKVLVGAVGYADSKLDWGIRDAGILDANPLAINKGVRSKTKGDKTRNHRMFLATNNEAK